MLVFLVWNWISFAFLSRLYILYFFSLFVIYTMYGIGFCVFIRWSGTQMNLICRPKCGESLCFDHPLIIHIVVSANSQNAGLPLLHKKKNTCTYIIWFGDERAQIAVFHERQQYMRLHLVINHNSDQPHYVSMIEIRHQHGFHQKLHQIPHVVAMCCTQIQDAIVHSFIQCCQGLETQGLRPALIHTFLVSTLWMSAINRRKASASTILTGNPQSTTRFLTKELTNFTCCGLLALYLAATSVVLDATLAYSVLENFRGLELPRTRTRTRTRTWKLVLGDPRGQRLSSRTTLRSSVCPSVHHPINQLINQSMKLPSIMH